MAGGMGHLSPQSTDVQRPHRVAPVEQATCPLLALRRLQAPLPALLEPSVASAGLAGRDDAVHHTTPTFDWPRCAPPTPTAVETAATPHPPEVAEAGRAQPHPLPCHYIVAASDALRFRVCSLGHHGEVHEPGPGRWKGPTASPWSQSHGTTLDIPAFAPGAARLMAFTHWSISPSAGATCGRHSYRARRRRSAANILPANWWTSGHTPGAAAKRHLSHTQCMHSSVSACALSLSLSHTHTERGRGREGERGGERGCMHCVSPGRYCRS